MPWLDFLTKRKAPEPEPKPGCPQHGEDFLVEVTAMGDAERTFLCGKCGWHTDKDRHTVKATWPVPK